MNEEPELCSGPWYSRAWAWLREATVFTGFFAIWPMFIMSGELAPVEDFYLTPKSVKITCAKCGKPIDKLESSYDHMRAQRTFALSCHGEVELVHVQDELLEGSDAVELGDYVAFAPRAELPGS